MVNDIRTKASSVLFILESPHTKEIKDGIPLLGDSGIVFSKALLCDKKTPAGLQIKEGKIPFSIMNTFQNSLQLSSELSRLNAKIKALNFKNLGIDKYKKRVRDIINYDPESAYLSDSYKERLRSQLNCSIEPIKIVVCGVIAQVYFETTLDVSDVRFGYVTTLEVLDKNIQILYVEHPSPKNSNTHWTPLINNKKLSKLQEFVNY